MTEFPYTVHQYDHDGAWCEQSKFRTRREALTEYKRIVETPPDGTGRVALVWMVSAWLLCAEHVAGANV